MVCINATLQESTKDEAAEWVEDLLNVAYLKGIKRNRRFKVFVNPFSGKGKSVKLFNRVVKPILDYGKCTLDVTFTTHRKHAAEVAKEINLDYDAIVIISGDGLVHEIFNGFAEHENPRAAFAIPLAPVPTGSGNGCCLSLLGLKDGLDPAMAALNAIKGTHMRSDLCSVVQNDLRTISCMSVSMGLMADLDINTENLRWMGDTRFVYGFLRGIIRQRPCSIKVSLKAPQRDKYKMHETYQSTWHKQGEDGETCWDDLPPSEKLPPLKYSETDTDGWEDFDVPTLYFYGGLMPYVSQDLLQWPLGLPNDGSIDIAIQETVPLASLVSQMSIAPYGGQYWLKTQHYFKAAAYRIKTSDTGVLAIDGEDTPWNDFRVEVHKGMGAFLSPSGRYGVHFNIPVPTPPTK
ncbi:hypothetical protein BDM02DRAFT_3111507 [Thelephora ganbajun]|uniref:Uncharacterized protein n=1 Tax=Thelephora ganbajun TaxID=370292 RepID=A0ACB6ZMA6_THEGA|nr:hypothetical protein BDM02DRAFT_3111507 [Thelephora ganbajun]